MSKFFTVVGFFCLILAGKSYADSTQTKTDAFKFEDYSRLSEMEPSKIISYIYKVYGVSVRLDKRIDKTVAQSELVQLEDHLFYTFAGAFTGTPQDSMSLRSRYKHQMAFPEEIRALAVDDGGALEIANYTNGNQHEEYEETGLTRQAIAAHFNLNMRRFIQSALENPDMRIHLSIVPVNSLLGVSKTAFDKKAKIFKYSYEVNSGLDHSFQGFKGLNQKRSGFVAGYYVTTREIKAGETGLSRKDFKAMIRNGIKTADETLPRGFDIFDLLKGGRYVSYLIPKDIAKGVPIRAKYDTGTAFDWHILESEIE